MEILTGFVLGFLFGYFWGKENGREGGIFDERLIWTESLGINIFDPEFTKIIREVKSSSPEGLHSARETMKKYIFTYKNKN